MDFSKMLADSSMVPRAYQGKPQDIMVCVQWGYEIGLAPMQALQNIAVINGKPSVYGDAAMALVQASPVCEGVDEYIEGEGTPNPVAVCVATRKGRKPVTAKFSVEDAKRAGLWGKQGPWQAYPKRMLQMRARGFALRDAFPDVLKGLITAEEAQDYPEELNRSKVAKDITPRNPLDAVAAPALPVSDPMVIEEAMADTVEEPVVLAEQLHEAAVELEQQAEEVLQAVEDIVAEAAPVIGFAIRVPGKDQPFSVHDSLDDWGNAYEDLADKTARAGKVPARERMTKLRELKELNQETLDRIDTIKRIRHTAGHQKRIKALGALLNPGEE
uniref:RecT protein n=1 Tax=Podoviridae sp. ctwJH20 TaxID=2827753 RepID=A0A8S5TBE0_9CAUD|nr:MAG TPA: RecT protein [Podoviridae sp. ctwJH20]